MANEAQTSGFCRECGRPVRSGVAYCTACGHALWQEPPAPAVPSSPQPAVAPVAVETPAPPAPEDSAPLDEVVEPVAPQPAPEPPVDIATAPVPVGMLQVIEGPVPAQSFPLHEGAVAIGRHAENDVVLADRTVSQRHAKVVVEAGRCTVYDLASTNGTVVNEQKVMKHRLRNGDDIRFGAVVTRFETEPPEPAAPSE